MSNIKINHNITVQGVLNIESNGRIIMSIDDVGDIPLDELLNSIDGYRIMLSANCDVDFVMTMINT